MGEKIPLREFRNYTCTVMRECAHLRESGCPLSAGIWVSLDKGFFGALDLKTGRLLTEEASTFNGETFGYFLHYLLQSTQGKLLLILDNAKYHRARILKEFFVQNQERLYLVFLPPYSPELNPIERVWRITRRQVTHNRYFASVIELRTALASHFLRWQRPNIALEVLCAKI